MTLLTIAAACLMLMAISLQRTYMNVSHKELKHRARHGDEIAKGLAKAVGYGHSLRAVLWFLIIVFSSGFFVLITRTAPPWFALAAVAVIIWIGFIWLPAAKISRYTLMLASWLAPVLAKLLFYIHPILDWFERLVRRYKPLHFHSGLYDRQDLLELLARQEVQADNRIEKQELEMAKHALSFGDKTIGERMVPKRQVRLVSAEDTLGPIIMDELHASGHSRFPVYDEKKTNIVGTLYLHDLVRAKEGGTIRKLMRPKVYYLHEDQSLYDGLQALLKTHHHLFIVINEFEDFVGVISSEDILEELVGKPIMDEFDRYEDLRAVATRSAAEEHQDHVEQEVEVSESEDQVDESKPEDAEKVSSEETEVVE